MRFSNDQLTPEGSRILTIARRTRTGLLSAAVLLAATNASAADITVITADKAVETTPRVGLGDGLCGHFVQAAGGGTVNNAALATAILSGAPGAPAQKAPPGLNNGDSAFYGIAYLVDYYDDTPGTNGSFGFDALFPWSRSQSGQICVSQQGDHAPTQGDAFAAGFTGLLNVKTAGTKTFAIGSDDGYRLRIGGTTVAAFDANRSPALDTRRVTFDAPGVYEVELIYWEQGGVALLEWSISDEEVVFTGSAAGNPVAPGTPGANDLTQAPTATLPASFITVGRSTGYQIFLREADTEDGTCGPKVGLPSDICVLSDSARLCGDGGISQIATPIAGTDPVKYTYSVEECDDGNDKSNDGCSNGCKVEPGYECVGSPSVCDNDADNDGLPNNVEDTIGTDKNNPDTDGDGLSDGVEAPNGNGIDTDKNNKIDALDPDDDGDGILTKDEIAAATGASLTDDVDTDGNKNYLDDDADDDGIKDLADGTGDADGDGKPNFLDKDDKDGPNGDLDGDGISNDIEDKTGTDKTKDDSDGDGIKDGVEDANKDGKIDANETDPRKDDTDGDGLKDGVEDANKDGVKDATETDPRVPDTDGDGLSDGVEDANKDGVKDATETDPLKGDTDGGGVNDGQEVNTDKTNPLDPADDKKIAGDQDGDGIPDDIEDPNKDGVVDPGETDKTKSDTDGDGLGDGLEDTNKDGKVDAGETDPRKGDTDGDGLGDGVEDANKDGKVDTTETDPRKADTDNGGVNDGQEVNVDQTNPLDPADDKVGGSGGASGSGGAAGSAGTAGNAGTAGAAGNAGTAGAGGKAGSAGSAGSSGTGGKAGGAGSAGSAGAGGKAGTAGAAGSTGTAGKAGNTGTAGTGGSNATAGTGGSGNNNAGGSTTVVTDPNLGADLEGGGCAIATPGNEGTSSSILGLGLIAGLIARLRRRR